MSLPFLIPRSSNMTAIRTVRVLRPLRAITRIRGMKVKRVGGGAMWVELAAPGAGMRGLARIVWRVRSASTRAVLVGRTVRTHFSSQVLAASSGRCAVMLHAA